MNKIEEILIVENFLTEQECSCLMEEILNANLNLWETRKDGKDMSTLKLNNHKILINIFKRLTSYFDSSLKLQIIRLAHRTTINTIWDPHSDDEGGKEIKYGIVIYLNDDFDGGRINYVNLNFNYTPKAGSMVIHPANEDYKHFVEKVKSGTRYTLTSFARDL
jgi:2OG-Fe(II) oxygenase superfamily